jgi:hypothetical protein
MGNAYKIQENCMWRANGRINLHTLQWKPESRDRPVGSNSAVLIGLVGMVSSEGTTMSPDAGWQVSIYAQVKVTYVLTFINSLAGAQISYLSKNAPSDSWLLGSRTTCLTHIGSDNGKVQSLSLKTHASYPAGVLALSETVLWSRTSELYALGPLFLRYAGFTFVRLHSYRYFRVIPNA